MQSRYRRRGEHRVRRQWPPNLAAFISSSVCGDVVTNGVKATQHGPAVVLCRSNDQLIAKNGDRTTWTGLCAYAPIDCLHTEHQKSSHVDPADKSTRQWINFIGCERQQCQCHMRRRTHYLRRAQPTLGSPPTFWHVTGTRRQLIRYRQHVTTRPLHTRPALTENEHGMCPLTGHPQWSFKWILNRAAWTRLMIKMIF